MRDGAFANERRGRSWTLRVLVCVVTLLLGAQTTWPIAILYGSVMIVLLFAAERRRVV
jgi:hypothetical protein